MRRSIAAWTSTAERSGGAASATWATRRVYASFAQLLVLEARRLYADEPLAVELEQTVHALDSTTTDLMPTPP